MMALSTPESFGAPHGAGPQSRLLIVDDDMDAAEALEEVMTRKGYAVTTAHDVNTALDGAGAFHPDVALVDIRLGRESGIDLIGQFRQQHPKLPCILMTAYADLEMAIGAVRYGAHEFLRKPLKMELLEAALERCFRLVRLEREKEQAEDTLRITLDNLERRVEERTEELRQSEIRFRDFANIAADWLWETGPDLRFTFLSGGGKYTLGVKREELMDLNRLGMSQQQWDQKTPGLKRHLDHLRAQEAFSDFEATWQMHDGEVRIINLTGIPRFDQHDTFTGYRGVGRDITERKKLDLMKNEFVSTVSHELRTPLTSIKGALGVIIGNMSQELTKQAKELLDIAYTNVDRQINLVNDILDMEKLDSGDVKFDLRPLNLSRLVADGVDTNGGLAREYDVTFVLGDCISDLTVKGESDRLTQVIANFLSNAAKFSPQGSEVRISVSGDNGNAKVSISDNGPGIPEQFHEHIYERFSQADSSDIRQKGGTGLGLSIAKAIIDGHGGQIGFNSELGAGSTFFFTLPIFDTKQQ